ncbi:MAG: DNA polymerase II [Candidatus Schekmanbacteria bacterium]|nr:MAG: DNA polymerase II [Candidatus Schekmanbacteria bacterium]
MKNIEFEQNKILFGRDDEDSIVAVEFVDDCKVEIFTRRDGKISSRKEFFDPFILLEKEDYLVGLNEKYDVQKLKGDNFFKYLVRFKSWRSLEKAKKHFQKASGKPPSSPQAPYMFLNDPVHQYLLLTGKTLFNGMAMSDIHRLQIDIETYCEKGFEFSNPARKADRIVSIGLSDNRGWSYVIDGSKKKEPEMLEELNDIIQEKDPDVIEGHNIFKFDLDYIKVRAGMHKVKLNWGRGGIEPKSHNSRVTFAERAIDYTKWEIYGRHIIDTWLLSQAYDISARELDEYGLKSVAQHLGVASPDRVYIEGKRISEVFDTNPEELIKYNLDDVAETKALAEIFGEGYFIEAKIFPYSYQNVIVRGNATKINSLFLREYLYHSYSIPQIPEEKSNIEGGYTDIFITGVVKHVLHCDVRSLYPSLMLNFNIFPRKDTLKIFPSLLKDLRDFRVKAKEMSLKEKDEAKRNYYNALQSEFKILINSFYGYLAASFSNFADYEKAAEVTAKGRSIIKQMIKWLKERGCKPVEVDTDGIYFVPPENIKTEDDEEKLIKELSKSLPKGIEVEFDGRYKAMFSYKMKNYALLDHNGKLSIKGSGLKSRGMEKYLRQFLHDMIYLLLTGESSQCEELYNEYIKKIREHRFDIEMLAKTETLAISPESYRQKIADKKRNQAASYELAIKSGRNYQAGDQVSFYVTGTKKKVTVYDNCKLASEWDRNAPDENVEYYCQKLTDLYKKYLPFIKESSQKEMF